MNEIWQPLKEFGLPTVLVILMWYSYDRKTKRDEKRLDKQHEEHRVDRKEDSEKIAQRFDKLIDKIELEGDGRAKIINQVEKNCAKIDDRLENIESNVHENQAIIIKTYDNTTLLKNKLCEAK